MHISSCANLHFLLIEVETVIHRKAFRILQLLKSKTTHMQTAFDSHFTATRNGSCRGRCPGTWAESQTWKSSTAKASYNLYDMWPRSKETTELLEGLCCFLFGHSQNYMRTDVHAQKHTHTHTQGSHSLTLSMHLWPDLDHQLLTDHFDRQRMTKNKSHKLKKWNKKGFWCKQTTVHQTQFSQGSSGQ